MSEDAAAIADVFLCASLTFTDLKDGRSGS